MVALDKGGEFVEYVENGSKKLTCFICRRKIEFLIVSCLGLRRCQLDGTTLDQLNISWQVQASVLTIKYTSFLGGLYV